VSDHDEDHREPRGTYTAWLREQRAANECEACGAWMPKIGTLCVRCTPEDDDDE
jgi:predicted amidophosphoribosyltransferase